MPTSIAGRLWLSHWRGFFKRVGAFPAPVVISPRGAMHVGHSVFPIDLKASNDA